MDTHLLSAFITVAEQSSFSLAAESMGLTQSAVSKRIALLETDIGQPLFDRVGRNIELTEAGSALLPRAKTILQQMGDTRQFMMDLQGDVQCNLRIATSHHIGLHRLPKILKRFTQQYPNVHLQLHFIDSEQAQAAILHGEFDLALVTLSQSLLNDELDVLQHHPLWHDPMGFVANKHHPLSKRKRLLLEDFAEFSAILPDTNTYTTQLIQGLFSQQQLSLQLSMTTNHLDAIKMMISVGLGWSVLPETLIDKTLMPLPVKGITIARQLGCIHHRERTLGNAARAMLTLLKE